MTPFPRLREQTKRLFRQYIRCFYADQQGYLQCCSCGKWGPMETFDAGHYIHKRNNTYFDRKNCHPQCKQCNGYKDGSPREYALFLERRYGPGILQDLSERSKIPKIWTRQELESMREVYRDQIRALGYSPCC